MKKTLWVGLSLCLAMVAVLWTTTRAPEREKPTQPVKRPVPAFISYDDTGIDHGFRSFQTSRWNLTGIVKVDGSKGIEVNGDALNVGDVPAVPVCYLGYGSQVALIVSDYIPRPTEPGEKHHFLGVAFLDFPLDDNESEGTHCRPLEEDEVFPTIDLGSALRSTPVELWFTKGESLVRDFATVDSADGSATGVLAAAINAVLVPENGRVPSGHDSAIPSLAGPAYKVSSNGYILTVGLHEEFLSAGGDHSLSLALSLRMRTAQIVYTGTQFPGTDAVWLEIDGEPLDFIRGKGLDTSRPLTRADFKDLAGTRT